MSADLVHLNAHEPSPLPCLCKRCFEASGTEIEALGMRLHREQATAKGRVLYYWLPAELVDQKDDVRKAVEARMHALLKTLKERKP